MTATATDEETGTTTASKGFKPRYIALIVGGSFALLTAASYIAELLWAEQWNIDFAEEKDTREYFVNIPGAFRLVFYVVIIGAILWGAWTFSNRMKNWERGAPDNRKTNSKNIKRRMEDLRAGLYMQTLLRDPAAGIMHSLMYFSFLVLLAVTTVGEINLQLPPDAKFLVGDTYSAFAFVGDFAGLFFVIGVTLGDRPPLRAAPVPHQDQDQARARGDPRHDARHRPHRLRHRDVPHRARRHAELREVGVHRLPPGQGRRERQLDRRRPPAHVDRPHRELRRSS